MTMLRDAVTPMMLALLAVLCATTAVSAECAWAAVLILEINWYRTAIRAPGLGA